MIPLQEAYATILSHASPFETIALPLGQLLGHYLAEPVIAGEDIPRFDSSAVDGFGVRMSDVAEASEQAPVRLRLWAIVRAGEANDGELPAGCAVKVLTGAPIPRGVEAMVMREFCRESAQDVLIATPVREGDNIRRRGEEFRQGDRALEAGARVTPAVIGLLATLGLTKFEARRKPKVALLVTGNELAAPGQPLGPGQIYDSNSYALLAALQAMGIGDSQLSRAPDELETTRARLAEALAEADVVIAVGGVSVGDFDFVKEACAAAGARTHFWKVAIKPGKPLYFGTAHRPGGGEKLIFGLPGNPVAALLGFSELVKPALLTMMGAADVSRPLLTAALEAPLRKKAGRLELVRAVATVRDGRLYARATTGQDSHMLGGLARANCLIHFPREAVALAEGEVVAIELLGWE